MTTAAANLYQHRAASAPFSAGSKLKKAQKSGGFRTRNTYGAGIKDRVLIDPCMGSGHILVYMFDVLMDIYRSEGFHERDAVFKILKYNIYGLDIDKRAYQLAYFALLMKARQYNRKFFKEIELKIQKPNVQHFIESNDIEKQHIQFMGYLKEISEKNRYVKDLEYLIDKFYDAKEYGSIIEIKECNWEQLRSYVQDLKLGQMSLETTGISETQRKLIKLLDIGEIISQKYSAVVTNPPYLAVSGGDSKLNTYIKKNYPDSKNDLYAVFIEKCNELLKRYGYLAMITQHSWMFLSGYEELRKKLLIIDTINMVHLGARAFDEIGGEVVQTTSFVRRKLNIATYKGLYIRLLGLSGETEKEKGFFEQKNVYYTDQQKFKCIPGNPIGYWISKNLMRVYSNSIPLGSIASPRKGNSTSDNNRFLRLWYEVDFNKINLNATEITKEDSISKRWYPYNKGGGYRKWYGLNEYLVDWYDDAIAIRSIKSAVIANYQYFMKPGLTWSTVSSTNFSIRWFDEGFIFDNGGCCIFELGNKRPYLIALLNSSVFRYIFGQLNPTLNFQSGEVAKFPVIVEENEGIDKLAIENVALAKAEYDSFETSWDFKIHPLIRDTSLVEIAFKEWEIECECNFNKTKENEEEINRLFINIYGLNNEVLPEVNEQDITYRRADVSRDIKSLISYAVGCIFGRYSLEKAGVNYAGGEWNVNKYKRFLPNTDNVILITDEDYFTDDIVIKFCNFLEMAYGKENLENNLQFISNILGNNGTSPRETIRNYFVKDFYNDHLKVFQKRPIYWQFDSGKENGFKALIYIHRYNKDTVGLIRSDYLHKVQDSIERALQNSEYIITTTTSAVDKAKATKARDKYIKQLNEIRTYYQALSHVALQRIDIDLDDGVKVNYAKFQGIEVSNEGTKKQTIDLLAKI